MSETLTEEEVHEITGCARPNAQIDWLKKNGWVYHTTKAGRPVVGRMYARCKLAGINPAQAGQGGPAAWSPDLSKLAA